MNYAPVDTNPPVSLVDKITRSIEENEESLTHCKTEIAAQNARKVCLENTIITLRMLLADAKKNEMASPAVEETKPEKPVKKKKPQTSSKPEHKASSEETKTAIPEQCKPAVGTPMKEVAATLNTTTSIVASICTELGFNEEMSKNNYLLTNEQVDAVKTKVQSIQAAGQCG